jgi:Rieske Fe-S protein
LSGATEEGVLEERISRRKFVRLGAAIGVTTAGASVVAACGGGGGGEEGATTSSGGAGTTSGEMTSGGETEMGGSGGEVIAQASDVAQNSAMTFTDGGDPAVLVRLPSGDFVAYSAVCTHQQCEVAYQPETSELACPCHGSLFDPADDGQVLNGPAEQPLPGIPVQLQDGQVVKA